MAIWQNGTITGNRVDVDEVHGLDAVKLLSPKYVLNDGSAYGMLGFGIDVIPGGGTGDGGGGGGEGAGTPTGAWLWLLRAD